MSEFKKLLEEVSSETLIKVYLEKGKPTKKGLEKYPPYGIYKGDFSEEKDWEFWEVCTCKDDCPLDCKGECGCKACFTAYMDYLSKD